MHRSCGLRDAPTVLHVIESFGAGSAAAMSEFVDATPECRHHLLRATRPGEFIDEDTSGRFETVTELPTGHAARVRAVRRTVRALRPAVVHAHSSYAGAYGRLAVRTSAERRIVYSPHCFAFERGDLTPAVRLAIRCVERLLMLNTDTVAACSRREQHLAQALGARRSAYIPNTPRAHRVVSRAPQPTRAPTVVALGRLESQKDPEWFLAAIRAARAIQPELRATWIGDGDPRLRGALEAERVRVTGWVPSDSVAALLEGASAYLHPAAWEGFPLAVLEAVAAGTPVVARRIGAFEGMPVAWQASDPLEGAALVLEAIVDRDSNLAAWRGALAGNTPALQRAALADLYGVRAGRPSPEPAPVAVPVLG